jgi:hypothetical protein
MRKIVLLFAVLMNLSVAFAQSDLRLGINLDMMASWLTPKSNHIDNDGARPGIGGGLVVEYYFHKNYGFVTGLNLTAMGGNVLYDDEVGIKTGNDESVLLEPGSTVSYRLNYLSIPVGLKLKTNEIGYFTYFAQLGLMQQINVGAKASSTHTLLNKDNVGEEINLFEMGYFFGGGLEYNVGGQTSLYAGVFYKNGFTDVLSTPDHKAVLNNLTLRVGVLF